MFIRLQSYNKILIFIAILLVSCNTTKNDLAVALELAGSNRAELESVLEHYKGDPEKLTAAQFLIENMPAHISYRDSTIDKYYEIAHNLLKTDMPYREIRDSLINVRKNIYPGLERNPISDVKIMKADYLIYSIDRAFKVWNSEPIYTKF